LELVPRFAQPRRLALSRFPSELCFSPSRPIGIGVDFTVMHVGARQVEASDHIPVTPFIGSNPSGRLLRGPLSEWRVIQAVSLSDLEVTLNQSNARRGASG